jgi:hypothetical protein
MAPKKPTVAELEDKIKTLKSIGEVDRAKELEAELAALTGTKQQEVEHVAETDEFVLDQVTQDEYEHAGSKFAAVGKHLSEMGAIYWKTPNKSIAFPFTIIEDGPDNGKTGELIAGVEKKSIWKLHEVLDAIGVSMGTKVVNGIKKPMFDANEIPGKQFYSDWTPQRDTRSQEEGGTGREYAKPTAAIALSAVDQSVL